MMNLLRNRGAASRDRPLFRRLSEPVRYCPETDTMAIELRPWPGLTEETAVAHDAGSDLVIHDYAGDGEAWLWGIEHASQHPEHIVAALRELQRRQSVASE
jgi:hypothetical protein